MTVAAIFGTVLLVTLTTTSVAATDPLTDCNDNPDPAVQIRGCSEYIAHGKADNHNLAIAHVNRAIAFTMTGRNEPALADFEAAIKLDPASPLAYYNRGSLHLDTGRYDLAVTDFTAAIRIEPLFALAHYNRGLAHEQLDDREAAKADFKRALALDPSHEQAQEHLQALQKTSQK